MTAGPTVASLMQARVTCVQPNTLLRRALDLFETHQIRHLPVLDGDSVVAMLSDRDVQQALGYQSTEQHERLDWPVSRIMSEGVTSVVSSASLREALDALIETKYGALAVIDEGQLKGIISYIDVLRAFRDSLDAEE